MLSKENIPVNLARITAEILLSAKARKRLQRRAGGHFGNCRNCRAPNFLIGYRNAAEPNARFQGNITGGRLFQHIDHARLYTA